MKDKLQLGFFREETNLTVELSSPVMRRKETPSAWVCFPGNNPNVELSTLAVCKLPGLNLRRTASS